MLYPRIIPVLLIHNNGLVKTRNFSDPKYVGDPLNAVKIFNEKEVDELIVLNIDATVKKAEPDYKLIENMARECRMPLCYGGGIKNAEQANRIFSLGVEKISISSAAILQPGLISELAVQVGSQSVVVVIDAKKKTFGGYSTWINNGKFDTGKSPFDLAKMAEQEGAGEIVINSVDNDGMMSGYDLKLIQKTREVTNIPLTVVGGAGSLKDISEVIKQHKIIGVAAGSLFVFKGKYRAVLISYPDGKEKEIMIKENLSY